MVIFYPEVYMPMRKALSIASLGTYYLSGHKIHAVGSCFVSFFPSFFFFLFVLQSTYEKERSAESRSQFLVERGLFSV